MPVKILSFLQTDDMMSPNCVLVRNSYIRGPLADTNVSNTFQKQWWKSAILNFIRALSANITYYVTAISFVIIASQDDHNSVYTLNPDIHLMCDACKIELHRAESR